MIDKYVVSLEMAKRLKEAGWHEQTICFWCLIGNLKTYEVFNTQFHLLNKHYFKQNGIDWCYAPSASEILEKLTNKEILDYCNRNEAMKMGEYINIFRSPDRLAEIWLEARR